MGEETAGVANFGFPQWVRRPKPFRLESPDGPSVRFEVARP
jgi:hypothetical protein